MTDKSKSGEPVPPKAGESVFGRNYCADESGVGEAAPEPQPDTEPQICDDCGHEFGVWFASNPLWNRVIPSRTGMLCPCCFIVRAEASGVKCTGWELVPENLNGGAEAVAAQALPERDSAEKLARLFHELYECYAPNFGYKTRDESAVPWYEVPENNKQLMIAVCAEVGRAMAQAERLDAQSLENVKAEILSIREGTHPIQKLAKEKLEAVRESLEWALSNIPRPSLVRGQNDKHFANYKRALSILGSETV